LLDGNTNGNSAEAYTDGDNGTGIDGVGNIDDSSADLSVGCSLGSSDSSSVGSSVVASSLRSR
jgi:hypothetical protein